MSPSPDLAPGLFLGQDNLPRCWWCRSKDPADTVYQDYHDHEWGKPVHDDQLLFENLCLEAFQAGLSWITILRRREGFREAFDGFDIDTVAQYTDQDVERLMQDERIIRNRAKILATINNAKMTQNIQAKYGSLDSFIWQYDPPGRVGAPGHAMISTLASTDDSDALAKALKGEGFKFLGTTTVYAFMQAMGLVNDHLDGCAFRQI